MPLTEAALGRDQVDGQYPTQKVDGRGKSPGSRAALAKYGLKPGQTLNRSGNNGWKRAQARIAAFMSSAASDGSNVTRMDRILLAAYASALTPGPKGAHDRRLLIEHTAGRARMSHPDYVLALANHFQGVAKDKADLALKLLGDTLQTKSPDEVAAAFRAFADNPRGFIDAAEAHVKQEREADGADGDLAMADPTPALPGETREDDDEEPQP